MPGFGLALGYTLLYLGLIVLMPLAVLVAKASSLGLAGFWAAVTEDRVVAALKVSFGLSFAAAFVDAVFGLLVAWVLTRYRFPGSNLLDAAVDLPFALPTAVAGISLAALYAPNGWIGGLLEPYGVKIAYTPLGIFIAGNTPYVSEIAPLLIVIKLEEYNYAGATGIATIMLAISFVSLLAINLIQAWTRRRFGHV